MVSFLPTPSRRTTQVSLHNTKPSTSSQTTTTTITTMLFVALALLIDIFFVYVAIACMFWSFVVLLRFWCALLEIPVDADAAFELWRLVLYFGLGLYLWVLLDTLLVRVSSVACVMSSSVPDADPCRSSSLQKDA